MEKLIQNIYHWLICFERVLIGWYQIQNPIPVRVMRVRPEFRKIRSDNRF